MTSKQIKEIYENKEIGKLYKNYQKYFDIIDSWSEKMIAGDLLTEYDLHYAMQQLSGVYAKLNPVAGAFESLMEEYIHYKQIEEESKIEKLRIQDQNSCKEIARAFVSDLRNYASDFTRYCYCSNTMIVTCQSRLKRLTVESNIKGIDFTGDKSNIPQTSAKPETQKKWDE